MESEKVLLVCKIKSWKPLLIGTFIFGCIIFALLLMVDALATDVLSLIVSFIIFLIPFWIVCYEAYVNRNAELTITDKRVYGIGQFGKRLDLPLDSISAVASAWFLGRLIITTASGKIVFSRLDNRDLAHETINNLLVGRQKTNQNTIIQEVSNSNADELRKFKKLLEDGIITQEEFEAKKKQLLGL